MKGKSVKKSKEKGKKKSVKFLCRGLIDIVDFVEMNLIVDLKQDYVVGVVLLVSSISVNVLQEF